MDAAALQQIFGISFAIFGIITASVSGGATLPLVSGLIGCAFGTATTGFGVYRDRRALEKLCCGTSRKQDIIQENESLIKTQEVKHKLGLEFMEAISDNVKLLENPQNLGLFKLICDNQCLRNGGGNIDIAIQTEIFSILNDPNLPPIVKSTIVNIPPIVQILIRQQGTEQQLFSVNRQNYTT